MRSEHQGGGLFGGRLLLTLAIVAALAAAPTAAATTGSVNIVATAKSGSVAVYHGPKSKRPYMHLENTLNPGSPLAFLVRERADGWEQIYLPIRPNESTGWVRDSEVSLTWDPYLVQVSEKHHHVIVWDGQHVIVSVKAGIGQSVMPTPRGTYYIVDLLQQSDPNAVYGPYAFGLSAYSNVFQSFGGGPGEIGLHGTDDPAGLGTNVSHGCIRINNTTITRLAHILPLGTPVIIGS